MTLQQKIKELSSKVSSKAHKFESNTISRIKFHDFTYFLKKKLSLESVEEKCKSTINHAIALADRHQDHSTKLLKERTHDVYRLKSTLERAIKAQMDEISTMEVQRNRLMEALIILKMPESIGTFFDGFNPKKYNSIKILICPICPHSHGMHKCT